MTDFRRLFLVLTLALVARLVLIVPGFGTLNDPDNYLPLARSISEGQGFCNEKGRPTAYRPPLYPLVLAPIVATFGDALPWGVATLHLALGLGTVGLTYLTARRWALNPDRATIAALIVAFDPVALVWSRSVMTETFAAFLVAGTLAALTVWGRRGLILSGIAFGLTSLCRPSLLPWAGLYVTAILIVGPGGWRRRLTDFALISSMVILSLAPWAARNAYHFGEPVWTTTHGGHTLALANNPVYYADVVDGPPGAVWSGLNQETWFASLGPQTMGMTEPQADRYFRNQGLQMLRERPTTFLSASIARLGRFWGIAPSGAVYPLTLRIATACWTVPLWTALAIGFCRRGLWRLPTIAAPLALVALTVVHAVYWTDMRMRVPIIPAIALIAAGACYRRPAAASIDSETMR